MSHANARLTPAGRLIMVQRIQSGRAVAHVAAEMGISRTAAWRWWRRFREHGPAGLVDRSSVAHSHPRRTAACVETRVKSRGVVSFRLLPEGGGQAVRESSGRAGSVCSLRVRMRLRMEMSEK